MSHDPLCKEWHLEYPCICDLIARVMERERRLARERVLALPTENPFRGTVYRLAAAYAARGGE